VKRPVIFLVISAFLLVAALLFTFLPSDRYGFHTDALPCGKNEPREVFYTATTYFIFTRPLNKDSVFVGTCPYQNFSSSTYALEFWLSGILFGYFGYRRL